MPRSHLELLHHIADELDFLLSESAGVDEATFLDDEKAKRAFARSFEIIGEATKNLPNALTRKYPEVEWKAMARMRDRLIHRYFGVDYGLVWNTVKDDIPGLARKISRIIAESKGTEFNGGR